MQDESEGYIIYAYLSEKIISIFQWNFTYM